MSRDGWKGIIPIIILLQPRPIGEFLILQFLPVIAILILRIRCLKRFIRDPRHCQSERIIMRLLQHRPIVYI
jgi:hypothetical protein